ncbi:MAG: Beta-hydroxylase [Chitinophagaceae bacterium]|nr:Beta-hydroxylase [Chitinophagaceae bacterium]
MLKTAKEKIHHFITFKVLNHTLIGIGNLMTPFSKVSNKPVLSNEEFTWSKLLEDNWEAIRSEAAALLEHDDHLPNIEDIQPQEEALNKDNKWKTFFLYGFGIKSQKNCEKCPVTTKVLEQIPGMLTGFYSILYPGKHIPAHKGIFKGIVRTHLGLIIPENNGECKMRVGKEMIKWENGKAVFFDDTYQHEVWNNTDKIRVVLLIDTVRPYKKIGAKINNSIIKGITESMYVKQAFKKNEDWEKAYYSVFP